MRKNWKTKNFVIHDDPTAISDSTEESEYGSEGSEANDTVSKLSPNNVTKQEKHDDSDIDDSSEDEEANEIPNSLINRDDGKKLRRFLRSYKPELINIASVTDK